MSSPGALWSEDLGQAHAGDTDVRRVVGEAGGGGHSLGLCSHAQDVRVPLLQPGDATLGAGTAVGGGRAVPSALDPHTWLLDLWGDGSSSPERRPGAPMGGVGSERPDGPIGMRLVWEAGCRCWV